MKRIITFLTDILRDLKDIVLCENQEYVWKRSSCVDCGSIKITIRRLKTMKRYCLICAKNYR